MAETIFDGERRFTVAELLTLTDCTAPEWEARVAPDGWSLWKDYRGRLIVIHSDGYVPPTMRRKGEGTFKVFKPIIRVRAPTRYTFHADTLKRPEVLRAARRLFRVCEEMRPM